MEITLYIASSLDGFIADKLGDSSFVSEYDIAYFEKYISESEAIVVGGNTFRQFQGDIYPIAGKINFIFTSETVECFAKNEVYVCNSIEDILHKAEALKITKILLLGGGKLNNSFLTAKKINKLVIDIHPLLLGTGIPLFNGNEQKISLVLEKQHPIEAGQILLEYSIKYKE